MRKKITKEEFINKVNVIHNNKYDYTNTIINGLNNKITILCLEHGEFEQLASGHLRGQGCKKCFFDTRKKTFTEFINNANLIHNHKYIYDKVNYQNSLTKITIICPKHGEFIQTPHNHLHGNGCNKCNGGIKMNCDEFISKGNDIHSNRYDYSLVNYINNKTKVKILCPIHDKFEQTPNSHLSGKGCSKCGDLRKNINTKMSCNEFLNKAKKIHNDKYSYFNDYENLEIKIKISCPKHGIFEQNPKNHIYQKQGCPICKESKGEKEIRKLLKNKNIKFLPQHKFKECINIKPLPFDFYLPDHNICIEYHGEQHYEPIKHFGGHDKFKKQQKNDEIKSSYCNNYNVKLIIIKYDDSIPNVLNFLF